MARENQRDCPASARRLGDKAQLLVDANSGYTPAKAIEVGRMLQDYGVIHFEEPCPYWEHYWTAEVTRTLSLDVTGGEQDCDLTLWRYMIDNKVVDVVQPDVCYHRRCVADDEGGSMGRRGGNACHAAFSKPIIGDRFHAAYDGRDP